MQEEQEVKMLMMLDDADAVNVDSNSARRNGTDDTAGDKLEEGVVLVVLQPKKASEGW